MSNKNHNHNHDLGKEAAKKAQEAEENHKHEAEAAAEPEIVDVFNEEESDAPEAAEALGANAELQEQLTAALEQVEKDKHDYLLLAADFDNYRKRMMREKAELLKNAAERVLKDLLPIVDDFERALEAASSESGDAFAEGTRLIYKKLVKYLEANGVKAMESTGAAFDADIHEAIATIPAPSDEQKGKIIDTTQKGYMINDKVLRHAKVVVGE